MHTSVGVILPSNNYEDFTHAVFGFIRNQNENPWVYVTITKPFHAIKQRHQEIIDTINIQFIDCVSLAAGIKSNDPRCFFLDSPSQLEKLILEIMSYVKEKTPDKTAYVILDSLSSLILYNDELLVTEFFTHLINNLNLVNAHTISLCIEEEMNDMMHKMLYLKNEKILKIKESFI
jgi:hypothetical protein